MRLKLVENTTVFLFGGISYGICELIWRGFTHPSMLILGGICFLGLYIGEKKYRSLPLSLRCFSGGMFITSLELVCGSIVNTALGLNVWDYSNVPVNFLGQICLQFFIMWILLCIPAFVLCKTLSVLFDKPSGFEKYNK